MQVAAGFAFFGGETPRHFGYDESADSVVEGAAHDLVFSEGDRAVGVDGGMADADAHIRDFGRL